MAKQRTFISVPPTANPYPVAICAACALFLAISAGEATAGDNDAVTRQRVAVSDAISKLPSAPAHGKAANSHPVKSAISKPAPRPLPAKLPQANRTTVLTTSGGTRVVRRRAGSLRQIAPEKSAGARFALTAPGELAEADMPAPAIASSPVAGAEATSTATTPAVATPQDVPATTQDLALTEPAAATADVPATEASVEPIADETTPAAPTPPPVEVPTAPADPNAKTSAQPGAPQNSAKLYAPSVSYDRGTIIAEGNAETPVRLESGDARIIAQKVILDTENRTVKAIGKVRVERQVTVERYNTTQPKSIVAKRTYQERITETLEGEDFEYNFGTKQGKLDKTSIVLQNFNITAEQIIINGSRYIGKNVVIRPGGLTPEEIKIYGTPPFNIRAPEVIVDRGKLVDNNNQVVGDTEKSDEPKGPGVFRTQVKGAALYFKNLRLMPIPSALLGRTFGRREQETYQITPRISFNSADGVFVTTQIQFPLAKNDPGKLNFITDIGLSTKVGFRGGMELRSSSKIGRVSLGARINDVISSQLTDRIELDRLPEVQYRPPDIPLFNLPGGRKAGFRLGFVAGDYRESFTNQSRVVKDSRFQAQIRFTTRLANEEGIYVDLMSRLAHYGDHPDHLSTAGFEIGYTGHLGSRLNGQFSLSMQKVSGSTPFRFDRVEIEKELRTTFDVLLSPRYIIPIDLRYDLDRHILRDKSFGLLRNYKTFAYGVVYQSSRHEVRLEIRQGF